MPIFISEHSKLVHKEKVRVARRTSRLPLKLGLTGASKQISIKAASLTNAGRPVQEMESVVLPGSLQLGFSTNIHISFA